MKKYEKDGLTIVWKPEPCIHSGICVKSLPNVYKPEERPWINPENASNEQIIKQIEHCPSGALS